MNNLKFEVQTHQVTSAAILLQAKYLVVLQEALTRCGRRRGEFLRDFVDPVRKHSTDSCDDRGVTATSRLDVSQGVIDVTVCRILAG